MANARAMATRRAMPSDSARETRRGTARDRARQAGHRQVRRSGVRWASRRFCERFARAAGAAPETRCRCAGARRRASRARPRNSVSRPPMMRSIVVLPQPDGPTSATISRAPSVRSILPSTGRSAAIGAERLALDAKSQDHLRHRVAQRSRGCTMPHSIACATRMNASV